LKEKYTNGGLDELGFWTNLLALMEQHPGASFDEL